MSRTTRYRAAGIALMACVCLALLASPVAAQAESASLRRVVDNARLWVTGILASLATLYFVVGAARYVMAGGDPGQVERAKQTLKAAMAGYALALLAPAVVTILRGIVRA